MTSATQPSPEARGRKPPAEVRALRPVRAAGPDPSLLASLTTEFAGRAERHDREASFPAEHFRSLHAHGLLALVVPAALGGGGAGLAATRRVIAAVAEGCPATALVLTMTCLTHRGLNQGDNRWPPALREAVLRSAVTEGALANSLRVEPELGSPARGGLPATIARRAGHQWQLSGHKLYSTGMGLTDTEGLTWLLVWARTDEPEPRVGAFLVPRSAPGVRVVATWDHLGLRASGSHDVLFESAAIPLDHPGSG